VARRMNKCQEYPFNVVPELSRQPSKSLPTRFPISDSFEIKLVDFIFFPERTLKKLPKSKISEFLGHSLILY
jgi:hypothetical protein